MIATERSAATFRHEAYVYGSPEQFTADMTEFITGGLRAGDAVAVAETPENIDLLRHRLGEDAQRVDFLDMLSVGANPARIIAVWEAAVTSARARGQTLRGIGEPAWPGRRPAELTECRLHELLLNAAFDPGPPWWLVCPYDATRLPTEVVDEALHTHPSRIAADGSSANPGYDPEGPARALAEPLPPPPPHALHHDYDARSLGELRSVIRRFVDVLGLDPAIRESMVLAGWEVGVNSVMHGGGAGRLSAWRDPGVVACQFDDAGHIGDPLVGRLAPAQGRRGGRGVYLANHLCDLVQVRSSPGEGTSVRLLSWT